MACSLCDTLGDGFEGRTKQFHEGFHSLCSYVQGMIESLLTEGSAGGRQEQMCSMRGAPMVGQKHLTTLT